MFTCCERIASPCNTPPVPDTKRTKARGASAGRAISLPRVLLAPVTLLKHRNYKGIICQMEITAAAAAATTNNQRNKDNK
jgi:hypothetical protein